MANNGWHEDFEDETFPPELLDGLDDGFDEDDWQDFEDDFDYTDYFDDEVANLNLTTDEAENFF